MRRVVQLFIILVPLLLGCHQNNDDGWRSIDLHLSSVPDVISIDEIASNIEIIPFENVDDAYLNPTTMSGFRFKDDNIFFLDRVNHVVQIYDLSGKYIKSVDKHGRGPGEYIMENEIFINPADDAMDLITQNGVIYSYDIDNGFEFTSARSIADEIGSVNNCIMHPFGKGYFFYSPFSNHALGYLDFTENVVKYFDYSIDASMARSLYSTSPTPFSIYNNQVLFLEGFSGKVYTLDERTMSMTPHVFLNAGKFAFKGTKIDNTKADNIPQAFQKMREMSKSLASPFNRYCETDAAIYFEFYFDEAWRTAVYDKRNDKCRTFKMTKEGLMFSVGEIVDNQMYLMMDPMFLSKYVDIANEESAGSVSDDDNYLLMVYHLVD